MIKMAGISRDRRYLISKKKNNKKVLITKDLEKHFRIKSSDIKTCRFGDDMSPLSNVNYNKVGNII